MTDCVVLLFRSSQLFKAEYAYVSPEGSSVYDDLEDTDGIVKIQSDIETINLNFPDCYIFFAGDTNARTKTLPDFLSDDNLSYIFGDSDYDGSTFSLPRNNKDNICNNFGKSLLNLCYIYDIQDSR